MDNRQEQIYWCNGRISWLWYQWRAWNGQAIDGIVLKISEIVSGLNISIPENIAWTSWRQLLNVLGKVLRVLGKLLNRVIMLWYRASITRIIQNLDVLNEEDL